MKHPSRKLQRKIDEVTQLRHTIECNVKIVMALNERIKELTDENARLHKLLKSNAEE